MYGINNDSTTNNEGAKIASILNVNYVIRRVTTNDGPAGSPRLEVVDPDPGSLGKDDERRWDSELLLRPFVRTSMEPTEMGA